ncbi:MAG: cytochrome P450 [Anaerolineae bacterium]
MKILKQRLRRRFNELQLRLDPISYIENVYHEHGGLVEWEYDNPATVLAVGHEHTKEVMSQRVFHNQTLRGPEGSGLETLLNGLVFLNGASHKKQRRLIAPSFHKEAVNSYFEHMRGISEYVVGTLPEDQFFDVVPRLTDYTFRVTLRCLFGIDDDFSELGEKINSWVKALTNPLAYVLPFSVPGLPYRNLLKLSDELVAETAVILESLRANPDASGIMSALMETRDEDGNQLSDEELIGHVNLIFLAGHETTRNSLTFILYLLAQHPNIARRLRDEIIEATSEGVTLENVVKIEQLNHVIWESLRLLPPTAWMDKYASEDVEFAGKTYPQGTMVILCHYLNHRNPEIYPDPNCFVPSRWAGSNPPPYSFVPFGGGFRMCIGSEFAMLEMRTLLTILLRDYSFVLQDQQLDRLIRATMRVKGPMMMRMSRTTDFNRAEITGHLGDMIDFQTAEPVT